MTSHVRLAIEREGHPERTLREIVDPFAGLFTGTGPVAGVAITVQKNAEFGRVKVVAHVSLSCDQNEKSLNLAGQKAFAKARQFVQVGFDILCEEEGVAFTEEQSTSWENEA